MKSFYLSVILLMFSLPFYAQITTLTLSDDNVCNGDIVTATLHSKDSLLVPAIGGNANAGYMFDIDAHYQLTITGFKVNFVGGPASFEVYYRYGTHVGYETSAPDWTLLGTSTGIAEGTNVDIGINFSVPVDSGQTVAFYVTRTDGPSVIYNNGTAVGNVIAENTNYLSVKTGVGKAYPFGATNANRNFEGTVLYEPGFTSVVWNNGVEDTTVVDYTIDRTLCIEAKAYYKGSTAIVRKQIVNSKEIDVTIQANPDFILEGGSSTLTSHAHLKKGLATTFEESVYAFRGIMFDVVASKDISIRGLSTTLLNTDATVEIFYKTGTHDGFQTNAGAWTSLGEATAVPFGTDRLIPVNINLSIASGDRVAFYIARKDGSNLRYSGGTAIGNVCGDDGNLQIEEGTGLADFFATPLSPRIPHIVVLYEVDNFTTAGMTYSWSTGSPSGSVIVSPLTTTNYSLTVTYDGCSASDTITMIVSGVGMDELAGGSVRVFPNPTTDNITLTIDNDNLKGMTYRVVDVYGRVISENSIESASTIIGFESEAAGVYFVQLIDKKVVKTSFKVVKQ
jgi:hypothetical protein